MLGQVSCVVTAWKGYLLGQLGHCLEKLLVGATWTLLGQVFCWTPGVTWMLLGQVSYMSTVDPRLSEPRLSEPSIIRIQKQMKIIGDLIS